LNYFRWAAERRPSRFGSWGSFRGSGQCDRDVKSNARQPAVTRRRAELASHQMSCVLSLLDPAGHASTKHFDAAEERRSWDDLQVSNLFGGVFRLTSIELSSVMTPSSIASSQRGLSTEANYAAPRTGH
jgi:hypothetical protein